MLCGRALPFVGKPRISEIPETVHSNPERVRMRALRFLLLALLAAALPTVLLAGCGGRETVTIFYTTDAHGHIASGLDSIGLDRISALRRSVPGAVLVDAGDFLHGSSLANLSQGLDVVRLMKESGYFAAAVGNHEFSHGRPALESARRLAAEEPPLHLLSANIRQEQANGGGRLFESSASLNVNGVKLCLFGLTTPETRTQASPEAVAGLVFESPADCALAQVAELRGQGCELVVALAHLGSDLQVPYKSTDLAAEVPGLDLVIDGHSHLVLDERVHGVPVVSSGYYGKALGRLDIVYDREAGRVLEIRNRLIPPAQATASDPLLAAGLAELAERRASLLGEVVARSSRALSVEESEARTREIGAGNMCADAMRRAYGSDFALINGGNIRQGLPAGEIQRGDIQDMLPFGGLLVELEVSGAELRDILEHGLAALPGADGAFPQVSGLRLVADPAKPAGQRVLEVTLPDGRAVLAGRAYRLTVNDFLAGGGDGYPHLAGKARRQSHVYLEEAVIELLRKKDAGGYLEPEGRLLLRRKDARKSSGSGRLGDSREPEDKFREDTR